MYFFKHPIAFIDYLVARIFISDVAFYIAGIAFIAISLTYRKQIFLEVDNKVSNWMSENQRSNIKNLLNQYTIIGNAIFHIIVCLIFAIYFFTVGEKSIAYAFLFVVVFSWGFNRLLKLIFRRERPVDVAGEVKKRISFSYPSGHVMASIPIYFFTAMILKSEVSFLPFYIMAFLLSLIVILTRIYLNHHFFTDVIAGIFMGIVCLRLTVWFYFVF